MVGSPGEVKKENQKDKDKDAKPAKPSFSCAECRRLKLKCSRVWPCTSCVKRGCPQICPKGELRTGSGRRVILADTEELHQRIQALEVALADTHAQLSNAPHPLLSNTYTYAPSRGPTVPQPRSRPIDALGAPAGDEVEGAFGTLTITPQGEARFVGSFAGSEYLREEGEDGQDGSAPVIPLTPPQSATDVGNGFPRGSGEEAFGSYIISGPTAYDIEALREELPDWVSEGRALCDSYWDNVNWMYQIIPRIMFEGDHLLKAYDTESKPNPHKLACVFLVMALGAMFDLNRQPYHPRGYKLFSLGRACLSVIGLEHSSPATIQALTLCGTFILNDKQGNGTEVFWPVLGSAVKIALALGLHRDGTLFQGLSEHETEERRQVWWELVTYDRLQAMCFARPYATSNRASDTKLPHCDDENLSDFDIFHTAKYRLIALFEKVIDVQTQVAPVSQAAVKALDKEVEDFKKSLPETLLPLVRIEELPLDRMIHPHLVIHRLNIRLLVAQTRLLLNRPFFSRALKDKPEDPSSSKFGASFVALYESAQEIVQLVKQLVIYHPSLIARWWFFWFHAFSSAVCLAAITIRAPGCAFATPALHGMIIVCDISAAAREGCRAKRGLPILLRLRKRAYDALRLATQSNTGPSPASDSQDGDDDLSHLSSSAKLRRVSSPPVKRASMSPGLAGMVDFNTPVEHNTSPSDSAATSTTLAENGMFEGIVPAFPTEIPSYSNMAQPMPSMPLPQTHPGPHFPTPTSMVMSQNMPNHSQSQSPNWPLFSPISSSANSAHSSWPMDTPMSLADGHMNGFDMNLNASMPMTMSSDSMDLDMSRALGLVGGGVQGDDMDLGFDFEAFVRNMGEGQM